MAADEAARPEGRHGPRRRAPRALRVAGARPGPRLQRRTRPWQARDGGVVPVRGDARPARGRPSRSRPTWRSAGRWTGSSSATSATARPRSRCGRRSRRSRTASRSRSSSRRPSSRPQHHQTFSQRFATFPIQVRLLSRFVAPAEQKRTIAGLEDGSVDLVIGTHRLLSKDVKFRDLGLVVVDEEQRFGVAAQGAAEAAPARGRRADAVRDADPADAQPRPGRRPRHVGHRDAAGGSAADPDAGRRGLGRARPRRDPARARPRRPGLLRPQPGRDDRGPDRAAPAAAAGRAVRRRPRPDAGGLAREGDDHVRRRARPTSSSARRSSSPAWTSRTRTRSSSTGPTRSGWPSSTSSAGASGGRRGGRTRTCSTGAASG